MTVLTAGKIREARRQLQDRPVGGPIEIQENANLTITGDPRLRTWRERLFSRPWRPFKRFEETKLPDPSIYKMSVPPLFIGMDLGSQPSRTVFIAHPHTAARLRSDLQRQATDQTGQKT